MIRQSVRAGTAVGLAMAATGWPITAARAESSTICGKVLTRDTVLPRGLYNCRGIGSGDGLIIGRDGITVDLSFSLIVGGYGAGVGIRNNGHDHVTIKNGSFERFETGIDLNRADRNRLIHLNAYELGGKYAVAVTRSRHVVLHDVHMGDAGGLLIAHGRDVTVRDGGAAEFGSAGFIVRDTSQSSFLRNSFGNEGSGGIQLVRSDHNVLRGNLMTGSELLGPGIELIDSDHNRVSRNHATGLRTRGAGIFLDRLSTGNAVLDNLTDDHPEHGISIANRHNVVSDNRSYRNGLLGISAPDGVKGHGNTAAGNGDPRQCTGVTCTPK